MTDPVDEKKTLEELKVKLEPSTELMKEVLGDKVEGAIVDDRTVDLLRVLTTSGHSLSVNMKCINANVSTNTFDQLERPQTTKQPTRQEREKKGRWNERRRKKGKRRKERGDRSRT